MLYYKKDTLINYCIVYGYFFDTETELSRCDRNYVLHCQTYLLFGHCQKSLLTPDSEEFNSDKPGLVQWPKNNMEEKYAKNWTLSFLVLLYSVLINLHLMPAPAIYFHWLSFLNQCDCCLFLSKSIVLFNYLRRSLGKIIAIYYVKVLCKFRALISPIFKGRNWSQNKFYSLSP